MPDESLHQAELKLYECTILTHMQLVTDMGRHMHPAAHTWPACGMVRSEESGAPGSAGMLSITVSVSTAMIPACGGHLIDEAKFCAC